MSVREAAKVLGITRQAVHYRIKANTITAKQELSSRSPRGFFWSVSPDSVAAVRSSREAKAASVSPAPTYEGA